MIYAEAFGTALLMMVLAILFERVFAHFRRENIEDAVHYAQAAEALREQQQMLDQLLERRTLPIIMRVRLIDLAVGALSEEGAHALLRALEVEHNPVLALADPAELDELNAAAEELSEVDPDAYELYTWFIRSLPIVSFMQRPETIKALGMLTLRLARAPVTSAAQASTYIRQSAHIQAA